MSIASLETSEPAFSAAPEIQTDRLVLRAHKIEDLASMAEMWSDDRVVAFISGQPFTHPQTWAKMLQYTGHWALMGFGYWAVELRQGSRFIGEVGLANFRRGLAHALSDAPEAGWVLSPECHGQGFAGEAMAAVLDWADHQARIPTTACIISPGNTVSIGLAHKLGYGALEEVSSNGNPVTVFARNAVEAK